MSSARTHDPQAVYHFIWRYHDENHIAPTLREIADGCGIGSTNTVTFILNRLQYKGLIKRIPHISRGIILFDPAANGMTYPESLAKTIKLFNEVLAACNCELLPDPSAPALPASEEQPAGKPLVDVFAKDEK